MRAPCKQRVGDVGVGSSEWSARWSGPGARPFFVNCCALAVSASCRMHGANLLHGCSCPTRHAPACLERPVRERVREKSARATPSHSGHFWSPQALALGPAPVAFSIGIRNGSDQLVSNRTRGSQKTLQRRGSGAHGTKNQSHRIASPVHSARRRHVPHYHHQPPLSSPNPISENAKKMKGHKKGGRESFSQHVQAGKKASPPVTSRQSQ